MLETQNLALFLVSCVLLNLTPGQDTLFIVGRSAAQGSRAGLISAFGIMTGVLVHTTLAAFGLSAVLAASALAFSMIKFAGAGYLIWLGVGFLRQGRSLTDSATPTENSAIRLWVLYRQGILTNLLNPKVSLFFLSFLPQFVNPGAERIVTSFLFLGLIFFTTGTLWCVVLAYGSAWLTERFRRKTVVGGVLKKATGILFIGLGLKLALSHAE
jgi:threonine/homoserine/homoserine lactone efflux protein